MAGTTMTFDLASGAEAAARKYIEQMAAAGDSVRAFSQEIVKFNDKGEVLSRTFRAITDEGKTLEATLKQTAGGFEFSSGKADGLTAAMKRQEQAAKQLKAELAFVAQENSKTGMQRIRTEDANTVGNMLIDKATTGKNLNTNQLNGIETQVMRIKLAIDSGSVSLQRFNEIYAAISANPKQLLPNLTKEEAQVASAIRTLNAGLSTTGKLAGEIGSKFYISFAGVVRLVEAQIIKRIAGAFQSLFVDSFSVAQRFSVQIAEIETISQTAGVTTDRWADAVRRLSVEFGNSQADVAEGVYQAVSNQVAKGTEAIEFMSTALRFSKASVSSAADSVNLLSSALRSFNLPVADTEKVAASFFKTIELGRVRAKDMADTFGRIGPIASEAGVSLYEVEAAITVLTNKGTKFADASTLINNIILKLLRPTDEMKKLFEEWGVASGASAISTFSFAGVLQKLDVEAQKGGARLGELFNQIRAVRSATGLTGAAFAEFNSSLSDITNSSDEYAEAIKKVTESTGDTFKRQWNEAKVAFEEAFGAPIIESITKAITAIGGLGPPIKFVSSLIGDTGKAVGSIFTSWKVLVGSAVVATGAWIVSMGGLSATFKALQADLLSASIGVKSFAAELTTLQSLTIFGAAFAASFVLGQSLFGENVEKAKELRKELERISDIKIDNIFAVNTKNTQDKTAFDAIRTLAKESTQILQKSQAETIKTAIDTKNKSVEAFRATTEATKVAGKGVLDSMNNGIKTLKEGVEKARTIIRESLNASEQLQRKLGDEIFSGRMKYASDGFLSESGFVIDEQKTSLIKARLTEISNLAREKFAEGTKESVDDARRLYTEAEKLTGDLFDTNEKKRRREFEDSVRRGLVAPSGTEIDSSGNMKARYDYTVSTIPLEQQLRSIANERLAAEQRLREEKERQIAIDEKAIAAEKERVRTVTQALELIAKVRVFNDKGEKVQDPVKAISEFDRQAETARAAAAQSSFAERLQLEQVLAQQRMALVQETTAFEKLTQANANQELTAVAGKNLERQITELETRSNEAQRRMGVRLKELINATDATDVSSLSKDKAVLPREALFLGADQVNDLRTLQQEIDKTRVVASGLATKFAETNDSNVYEEYNRSLITLIQQTEYYAKVREKFNLSEDQEAKRSVERLRNAVFEGNREFDAQQGNDENLRRMSIQILNTNSEVKNLATSYSDFASATAQNSQTVIQNYDSVLEKIRELTLATEQLKLTQLGEGITGSGSLPWEVEDNFFGKVPSYYARGFVPRGSDVKPAMLGMDEAVITGAATKAWSPLLRAINGGLKPNQMAGSSVTNVGDINVNVHGGDTAQQTINEIGKGLRRGIRRGQIRLS